MKRKIYGALALLGFLLILGAAGGRDLERISFAWAIGQSIIGLVLFGGGLFLGGFMGGWYEN